ncbi:hypothetical protein CPB84DRAFT_1833132 [Gymnopilus junonius]|uniref:EamA domain-containing protein n=1 Tax=Gymnopilus junonius TaxID=109634 RepID=A0A9P5P011_GYMJU|nr:hypothetical protein CPB84DRAFT_1833132 [Gymnopilus junonius]
MDTLQDDSATALQEPRKRRSSYHRDYFIGIGLLLLVVLLWTSSNFVTQDIYEGGYDKPFLITYMNTSSFALYLIPFLVRKWRTRLGIKPRSYPVERSSIEYQRLGNDDDRNSSLRQPDFLPESHITQVHQSLPLTERETASLAFTFCLIWFAANWSVNASLGYTSVASATILSSMSGFFTLAFGRLFHVEVLTVLKIGAVFTSFTGVVLVSKSDSETKRLWGSASHHTLHEMNVDSRATFGDALALVSALFYAMYVVLLKVQIKSEARVDMQLFFGFVGLFNILVCWPIGVVLHLARIEIFELPPNTKALYAVLVNMAITLSSDYLYVLAMLKTTPLVVTIGLSLTIPVAVLGDFIRNKPIHGQVIVGALLVLCSFLAVGSEDSREDVEDAPIPIAEDTP